MKKVNIKKTPKKVVEKKKRNLVNIYSEKFSMKMKKKQNLLFEFIFHHDWSQLHTESSLTQFGQFYTSSFFICLEIYSTYYTLQTYTHTPIWIKLDSRNHYIFDNDDSFLFFLLLHFFSTFSFFFV